MAFTGYMEEVDTESIWGISDFPGADNARFALINVRIGEVINFLVYGDATQEITDTAVLPIVEQISEEVMMELVIASKSNKFSDIWKFIIANISKMDWKHYDSYLLKKVRIRLGKQYSIKYSNSLTLRSHGD